jgi:hypothetical protein
VDIDGATQIDATVTVGVDDTGYDVKFFGATTGKSLLWDESADSLIVTGSTSLQGGLEVGVDDTGYDVKFFGATAGAYMLWDESADDLILGGAAGLSVNSTALVTGVLTTTAATVFNGGFTANADSTLGTDKKVQFRDAAIYINSSVDGQLDIVADTEIQIGTTLVDLNGNLNVSGTAIVTGVLTTTAATVHNGGITMPDSAIAKFGTGSDLQIYHDSANSYIEDSGTGSLFIRGTSLILEDAGGNDYIAMTDTGTGGTVELKHNAVTKLATTATGIDVTGTVVADGLTVDGLISTTASQSTDGQIRIRNSTTRASGNKYGIRFADSSFETNASIYAEQLSSGANGADLIFGTNNSTGGIGLTSATERMRISSSGGLITNPAAGGHAIFNEGAVDADFRVESDNQTHMLFVDAGNDRVGISDSAPTNALSVAWSSAGHDTGLDLRNEQLGGYGGSVSWYSTRSDDSSSVQAAQIRTFGEENWSSAATASSVMQFRVVKDSNFYEQFRLSGTEVVVNEDSRDTDFRVESDTNANALFVQGSDGFVGIGTSSPSRQLTVSNSDAALLLLESTGNDNGQLLFGDSASDTVGKVGYAHSTNHMFFNTNGSEAMRIDSSGHLIAPYGITLGTAVGTYAAANTLDDYEEGTYIPTIIPQSSGSITLQTGYDTLQYIKVGKLVTVSGRIRVDSVSSPTGNVHLSLPFTSAAIAEDAGRINGILAITAMPKAINAYGFHPTSDGFAYIQLADITGTSYTLGIGSSFSGDELLSVSITYRSA